MSWLTHRRTLLEWEDSTLQIALQIPYVHRAARSCCLRLAVPSAIPFADRVGHPFVSAIPRAIEIHDLLCQPHGYDPPVMHYYLPTVRLIE